VSVPFSLSLSRFFSYSILCHAHTHSLFFLFLG
jgi:hypothetical protein